MKTIKRWVGPVLAACLVGFLIFGLLRSNNGTATTTAPKPAPVFELKSYDNRVISSEAFMGKPWVLNFWASWCIPCREEAPLISRYAQKYQNQAAFVGITLNDRPEDARAFIQKYQLSFPSLIDPNTQTGIAYGVSGVPETFFIDAKGQIVAHKQGPLMEAELQDFLRLLAVKL